MPAGRPSKFDDVARVRKVDGREIPITVFDAIIEAMRIGDYIESAAVAAGISKHTAYGWLQTGAALTARQHRATERRQKPPKGTPYEQRCQQFSQAVAQASEEWHLATIGTLEQMARGGRKVTTVTEKVDANENMVERTTKVETLEPSIQALEWRLKHRFPGRYAERVEITGADGDPIEISITERAAGIAAEARAFLDGHDTALEAARRNGAQKATEGA